MKCVDHAKPIHFEVSLIRDDNKNFERMGSLPYTRKFCGLVETTSELHIQFQQDSTPTHQLLYLTGL